MRKWNLIVTIGIFVTFLIHGIAGGILIAGGTTTALKPIAWVCAALICVHAGISVSLTVETLQAQKKAGTAYGKENRLFWARRISGFAVLIPLILHLFIFRASDPDIYRLQVFTTGRMISQILLVVCIAFHALTNIRPLLIALGIRNHRSYLADVLFVLSVLLLLFVAAFAVYWLRWAAD